jgi:hypothetical protein
MGLREIIHTGLIGGRFLRAAVGKDGPNENLLAAEHHGGPGLRRLAASRQSAARDSSEAQDLKHERRRLHFRDLLPEPRDMAACDVAGFMRDHADQLVGRLRQEDRARVDEHIPAIDNEGVKARIVDQMHLDVIARHARRAKNRHRVVGDQSFGLGVADQAQLLRRRLRDGHGYREKRRKGDRQP